MGVEHNSLMSRQWHRNEFESGGKRPAQNAGKFFWSCPSTFLALKVQLVVLVSAFVMVSIVWSVSCLLFPRAQSFLKVGARAPVPYGVGATVSRPIKVRRNRHIMYISNIGHT